MEPYFNINPRKGKEGRTVHQEIHGQPWTPEKMRIQRFPWHPWSRQSKQKQCTAKTVGKNFSSAPPFNRGNTGRASIFKHTGMASEARPPPSDQAMQVWRARLDLLPVTSSTAFSSMPARGPYSKQALRPQQTCQYGLFITGDHPVKQETESIPWESMEPTSPN
jgi:hypothetical protein